MSSLRWPLAKLHQLQPAGGDEAVDVGDERLGHRIHQRGGGVVVAAVTDEEALHPAAVGQPGLPHVEIHPVDRLHLEHRVISKDISHTARYVIMGSGRRAASRPTNRSSGSYTGPARRSRSRPADRSPRPEPITGMSSGIGRSPASYSPLEEQGVVQSGVGITGGAGPPSVCLGRDDGVSRSQLDQRQRWPKLACDRRERQELGEAAGKVRGGLQQEEVRPR